MSERVESRSRRVVLYGSVGAVGGFAVWVLGLFVLFASAAFSPVTALLGIALLAGPGLALWVMSREPDQRPTDEELRLFPAVHLVTLAERLDPRGVVLALVVGTIGQVALASVSPIAALFALFAGLAAVWVLDPPEDARRDGDRHTPSAGTGLPTGPSGTPARILAFAIGSVFLFVGLALGWFLVTQALGEPAMEARLVAGLGVGSSVMLLFGGLFLSLGLGAELRL